MSVDERSRHQLYQRLQEVLGAEEATTLMEHLPPGGGSRVATKDDLQRTEEALRMEIRTGLGDQRAEMYRNSRNMILAFTAIVAAMNGLLAALLTLGG